MGSTEFAKGTWVGLELANGFKGKHNGTVEGTKYFSVNVKGQGVMVEAEKVKKRVASKKGKSGKSAKVKKVLWQQAKQNGNKQERVNLNIE